MTLCVIWPGEIRQDGYGRLPSAEDRGLAHRAIYEVARGPIPPGLELDHLCRVRSCVNPDHLEAVPRKENILRGMSPAALWAARITCLKGHPLEGSNLHRGAKRRACKTCWREDATRRRRARGVGVRTMRDGRVGRYSAMPDFGA